MKKLYYYFFFIVLVFSTFAFPEDKKEFTLDETIQIGLQENPGIEARQRAVQAKQEAFLAAKRMSNPEFEVQHLIEKRAQFGEVKELEAIKLRVETLKAQNELNKIRTDLTLVKGNLNSLLNNSLPSNFSVRGLLDFKLTGFSNKELDGTNKGFGLSLNVPLWNFNSREIAEAEFLDSQRTFFSIMFDYQDSLFTWNLDKASLEKTIGEDIK